MKKIGALLLLAGAVLGALFLPFADIGQTTGPPNLDRVLFVPTTYPTGDWEPSNLKYEDVFFRSADNTLLHGWYCPSLDADMTILIVHGNAGNVSTRTSLLQHLQSSVMANVFIFDYRGYGRSEGIPTVEGVLMDARAARIKLEELANTPASEFVIIGESIGGAVAVDLAADDSPRGLILQSTFSNLKELAGIHYPRYVPSVPSDVLNSTSMIQKYHGPLLQSHGENDRIIPITLGRSLFEMAVGEKQFLPIPEAGHNDWQTPEYFIQLDRFLHQFVTPSPDPLCCPSANYKTSIGINYVVVIGESTAFPKSRTVKLADITDGSKNTILVVESTSCHPKWTEPMDLDFDTMSFGVNSKHDLGISSNHPGGANVCFADGAAFFMTTAISEAKLRALLTIAGGESVTRDGLVKRGILLQR